MSIDSRLVRIRKCIVFPNYKPMNWLDVTMLLRLIPRQTWRQYFEHIDPNRDPVLTFNKTVISKNSFCSIWRQDRLIQLNGCQNENNFFYTFDHKFKTVDYTNLSTEFEWHTCKFESN